MLNGRPQAGHLTVLPANEGFAPTVRPQGQCTAIVPFSLDIPGGVFPATVGTRIAWPQLGHLIFFPAYLSGTATCLPQEHGTGIGMES